MTTSAIHPTSPSAELSSEGAPLRRTSTVDRSLVHRAALEEVFLTDTCALTKDRYLAAAQLPRSHAYFGDHLLRPRLYDPILLLEACRQATLAAAHRHFGVPPSCKFILTGHRIHLSHPQMLSVGSAPCELTMDVTISDRRERAGRVTGLDHRLALHIAGRKVGQAVLGMRYKSPDSYLSLRTANREGASLPSTATLVPFAPIGVPAAPGRVGRVDSANVVLVDLIETPTGAVATLRIPTAHPSMFDHPQDHLPGMVLTEAARQLAVAAVTEHYDLATTKTFLSDVDAVFTRFGELDTPTRLEATLGARRLLAPVSARVPSHAADDFADCDGTDNGDVAAIRVPVDIAVAQHGGPIAELRATVATLGRPRERGSAR